jgi:hypothetical protein
MFQAIPIIGDLIGKFLGYKVDQEANRHTETIAPHEQFAAEFRQLTKRTWFDSLIDGLNRLPRPTIVALVIGYFLTSWLDPVLFAEINAGLATVPSPMWYVLSAIIGFYFAARELHKFRTEGRSTFESAVSAAKDLAGLKAWKDRQSTGVQRKSAPEPKQERQDDTSSRIQQIWDDEDSA